MSEYEVLDNDAWLERIHSMMPDFRDINGEPLTLQTKISDVPGMAEKPVELPRFEDKNGNPVTLRTKLSDLNGFEF
tara:strand:- start:40132 stop:40359 length:228 start_codon:yes stop_codon:yes gene_type:complete